MTAAKKKKDELTIIKKYANRRLYDTGRSSYVTLEDLADMLREGYDFKVVDAKTEKDLTQSVLTQIIVEQESREGGPNLLPANFLKEMIKFYGGNMESFVPAYLEESMKNFVEYQEKMQESFGSMIPMPGQMPSMDAMEEMTKRNMDIMQKTVEMFTPFGNPFDETKKK